MRIKTVLFLSLFITVLNVTPVLAHEGHSHEDQLGLDTTVKTATSPAIPTLGQKVTEKDAREVKQLKADFKAEIEAKREAAKKTVETRKEVLREKLTAIKDARKKAVLQRLDNRFVTVNDTTTDKWAGALETMSGLLDRVGTEAADLKATGVDTTSLDASILRAENALTTAKTAVTTQAGKTYVMNVTSEAVVGTSVSTTVTQLRTDIRSTFLVMQNAKQAVRTAVVALNTAKKAPVEPTPVASESAGIEE